MGQLNIENGLDRDAVAVLTQVDGPWQVAVYVQNHTTYTISGIPDNTYDLYFAVGEDWDSGQARFTRKTERYRFEDQFPFTTSATTSSGWNVTLHPVQEGSARTESVPESEFPPIK